MAISDNITNIISKFSSTLKNFNLYNFETKLYEHIIKLYNNLVHSIIEGFCVSDYFLEKSKIYTLKNKAKKIKRRKTSLQLRTGTKISFSSFYANAKLENNDISRDLFHTLFKTISKSSTCYYNSVSMFSVIFPSFKTTNTLLKSQFINSNFNRIREISLKLGRQSLNNRIGIQFEKKETLKNKIILRSINGRRTRTKDYRNYKNEKGTYKLYITP